LIDNHVAQCGDLSGQVQNITVQLEGSRSAVTGLESRLRESHQQLHLMKQAEERGSHASFELVQTKALMARLEGKLAETKVQLDEQLAENISLRSQIQENEHSRGVVEELEERNQLLSSDLKDRELELSELKAEGIALSANAVQLKTEVHNAAWKLQFEYDSLRQKMEQIDQVCDTLKRDNKDIKVQKEVTERKLGQATQQLKESSMWLERIFDEISGGESLGIAEDVEPEPQLLSPRTCLVLWADETISIPDLTADGAMPASSILESQSKAALGRRITKEIREVLAELHRVKVKLWQESEEKALLKEMARNEQDRAAQSQQASDAAILDLKTELSIAQVHFVQVLALQRHLEVDRGLQRSTLTNWKRNVDAVKLQRHIMLSIRCQSLHPPSHLASSALAPRKDTGVPEGRRSSERALHSGTGSFLSDPLAISELGFGTSLVVRHDANPRILALMGKLPLRADSKLGKLPATWVQDTYSTMEGKGFRVLARTLQSFVHARIPQNAGSTTAPTPPISPSNQNPVEGDPFSISELSQQTVKEPNTARQFKSLLAK